MSDKKDGEEWLACRCAVPGCHTTIAIPEVLPEMRNDRGEVHLEMGLTAGRALCPKCGRTTYYSRAELFLGSRLNQSTKG